MDSADRRSQSTVLSAALRGVRAHRRMRASEVAAVMNMPLRSYEHFETGAGRLNVERLHRFAAATGSDPYAILAALALGSPEFARRCADNKLMTIFMVAAQEFVAEVGDDIGQLDARMIINAFTKALKDLGSKASRKDPGDDWLNDRVDRLNPPTRD